MRDHVPSRVSIQAERSKALLPAGGVPDFEQRKRERQAPRVRERLIAREIAKLKDLKAPGEGILRAVVSRASKKPLKHPQIADFRKMLHNYSILWMGFSSRRVVQICLLVQLSRMLEARKRKARADAEEAIRQHVSHPDACDIHLRMILKPLERPDIEGMMVEVFRQIHAEIISKAKSGAVVHCEAGRSPYYEPRCVTIGAEKGRECLLIVKRTVKGLKVITLLTEAEQRRRSRRNWRDRQRRRDRMGSFRRIERRDQREIH